MSDAPLMAARRERAAAAPRPARPRPPAKRGLLKSASRGRKEVGVGVGGMDIVWSWGSGIMQKYFCNDANGAGAQPRP